MEQFALVLLELFLQEPSSFTGKTVEIRLDQHDNTHGN